MCLGQFTRNMTKNSTRKVECPKCHEVITGTEREVMRQLVEHAGRHGIRGEIKWVEKDATAQ